MLYRIWENEEEWEKVKIARGCWQHCFMQRSSVSSQPAPLILAHHVANRWKTAEDVEPYGEAPF